jgi:uncharacterized protein (TIGR03000 family)
MFWKASSITGLLLLAGILMAPESAEARGGGGHFGGAHVGGAHFSGGHFAGAHFGAGHFSGARFNGSQFRGAHVGTPFGVTPHARAHVGTPFGVAPFGGARVGRPFGAVPFAGARFAGARFDHRNALGFRQARFFGSPFGPYGYGSYGYNPYSNPYDFASFVDSPVDNSAYAGASGSPYDDYSSSYPASSQSTGDTASHVTIQVPADAQLWVNGVLTSPTGPIRYLDSPPLTPGVAYQYLLQARWNENGTPVTQTQQVAIVAGTSIRVAFPIPSVGEVR